ISTSRPLLEYPLEYHGASSLDSPESLDCTSRSHYNRRTQRHSASSIYYTPEAFPSSDVSLCPELPTDEQPPAPQSLAPRRHPEPA
ncbi:hypothetical protein, partial [Sporisorium scitamineum]